MISKAREDFRFLRCILDEIMEKIKSEVRFNMHKIYFHSEIKCFNHLINVEPNFAIHFSTESLKKCIYKTYISRMFFQLIQCHVNEKALP